MPASSKTDPLLAKDNSISNCGSASVITYLGSKNPAKWHILQHEKGVRVCERNNCANTRVSKEARGGGASGASVEIPYSPLRRPW